MNIVETARVIKDKVGISLRDLKRGYSDEELKRELRISHGEITDEDRIRFRTEQTNRIFNLANGAGLYPTTLRDPSSVSNILDITLALDQIGRFNNLPDIDIDEMLASQARAKLVSWHVHPRVPRIVMPYPPFSNSRLK